MTLLRGGVEIAQGGVRIRLDAVAEHVHLAHQLPGAGMVSPGGQTQIVIGGRILLAHEIGATGLEILLSGCIGRPVIGGSEAAAVLRAERARQRQKKKTDRGFHDAMASQIMRGASHASKLAGGCDYCWCIQVSSAILTEEVRVWLPTVTRTM